MFKAPDGTEILGTFEQVPGVALLSWPTHNLAATASDFHYDGDTNMDWDSSTTQTIDGVKLFTDDDGADWLEHHLIPEELEPLSDATLELMRRELQIGNALEAARKLREAMQAIGSGNPLTLFIETKGAHSALAIAYRDAKEAALAAKNAEIAAQLKALEDE